MTKLPPRPSQRYLVMMSLLLCPNTSQEAQQ
jgi:hypothetical protein